MINDNKLFFFSYIHSPDQLTQISIQNIQLDGLSLLPNEDIFIEESPDEIHQ